MQVLITIISYLLHGYGRYAEYILDYKHSEEKLALHIMPFWKLNAQFVLYCFGASRTGSFSQRGQRASLKMTNAHIWPLWVAQRSCLIIAGLISLSLLQKILFWGLGDVRELREGVIFFLCTAATDLSSLAGDIVTLQLPSGQSLGSKGCNGETEREREKDLRVLIYILRLNQCVW